MQDIFQIAVRLLPAADVEEAVLLEKQLDAALGADFPDQRRLIGRRDMGHGYPVADLFQRFERVGRVPGFSRCFGIVQDDLCEAEMFEAGGVVAW